MSFGENQLKLIYEMYLNDTTPQQIKDKWKHVLSQIVR